MAEDESGAPPLPSQPLTMDLLNTSVGSSARPEDSRGSDPLSLSLSPLPFFASDLLFFLSLFLPPSSLTGSLPSHCLSLFFSSSSSIFSPPPPLYLPPFLPYLHLKGNLLSGAEHIYLLSN